ncbi:ATP-grasp domain-containing protein [Rummeliibacillus sp. TYF005]|nr:ATP-grasp domain-containing protein [Rummeliibacillus sp. POC4]RPJ94473.1 ATP-grasp domain-containing protein [Rummeliibacillus sp. TYF005]
MLGGSYIQIPIIKTAIEMGHYVITCDYLEDNPGHKYAHEYYNVSTTDKEGVLALAKSLNIDGIVCYASDPGAPTAAYVGERLGLSSQPYKSVEILSMKDKFREFQKKNNFNVPKSQGYSSLKEAMSDLHKFKFPIMIKPVDSSGSKGVSKIDSMEFFKQKVEYALSFSRSKRFIVEEYIESKGNFVSGDGFSVNGELVFRSFANTIFPKSGLNPFVPIGSSWPNYLPEQVQNKIHDEIQRLLNLLKLKTGAYNFEIIVDNLGNVYLMEIAARNGGEWVSQTTKYATGVDLLEYTIKAALGGNCSDLKMAPSKGYWGMYILNSQQTGIFKEVWLNEALKNNIVEFELVVQPGDYIEALTGSHQKIGLMILKFTSIEEMQEKMENITDLVKVILNNH